MLSTYPPDDSNAQFGLSVKDSRINQVLELQDNGTAILVTLDDARDQQKWTYTIADEVDDWFIWSNKAEDQSKNKFLSAIDNFNLILMGNE